MSRRHLRRGLEVFGGGLVITLATLIFMPDSRVIFGVLTLIGSSMLLMIPCDKLFSKINPMLGAVLSFVTFLFVYPVNSGYLGIGDMELITLPRECYSSLFSTYLGFPEPGFWSTDYFSVVPWFFLFVTGYFVYRIVFGNAVVGERPNGMSSEKCGKSRAEQAFAEINLSTTWVYRKKFFDYLYATSASGVWAAVCNYKLDQKLGGFLQKVRTPALYICKKHPLGRRRYLISRHRTCGCEFSNATSGLGAQACAILHI